MPVLNQPFIVFEEKFRQGFICLIWNWLWISLWQSSYENSSFILLSVSNQHRTAVRVSEEVANVCSLHSFQCHRFISYSGTHLLLSLDSAHKHVRKQARWFLQAVQCMALPLLLAVIRRTVKSKQRAMGLHATLPAQTHACLCACCCSLASSHHQCV